MRRGPIVVVILLALLPLACLPVPTDALRYGKNTLLESTDASFIGEVPQDQAAVSVDIVGDVNGDGYDDMLIGANFNNQAGTSAGKAYLCLGKPSGWAMGVNLSSCEASWTGEDAGDNAGLRVAGIGDANGDGFDDLAISGIMNDEVGTMAGEVYVIFGRASGWSKDVNLSNANASFRGEAAWDQAGAQLAGVGDVNGDGYDDFLIGAPCAAILGETKGKVYLILGKASGWANDQGLGTAASAIFIGEAHGDYLPYSLGGAGDVNGDGYDDMLMGSDSSQENGYGSGEVYLLLGMAGSWGKNVNISNVANASFIGACVNDTLGFSLGGGGDLNGDGLDDIVIGAAMNPEVAMSSGKAYVVFGRRTGWAMDTGINSVANASFRGDGTGYWTGNKVACNGDVDGDGLADLLISAPDPYVGGQLPGLVFLQLGRTGGWSMNVSVATMDASFKGTVPVGLSGRSLSLAGDVDGDGNDDLLIGGPGYNDNQGIIHVVLAQQSRPPSAVAAVTAFEETYQFALTSADIGDTIYVELTGTDGNSSWKDVTYVNVTSDSTPSGFQLKLHETGTSTGIYRGNFTVSSRTNEEYRWIKAVVDDIVTIRSVKDPTKNYTFSVRPSAVKLKPNTDVTTVAEDSAYRVHYWNSGMNTVSNWAFSTNATWLKWDAAVQDIYGTPNNTNIGRHWVNLTISDALGNTNGRNFTLTVLNTPPNITTNNTNTTLQSQPYLVDYNSTDDGQGNITWYMATNASWLRMNATTGVLNGTPSWNQTGLFWVNVSVSDGNGGWCNRSFNLTVTNVNDAPFILNDDIVVAYEDENYHVAYSAMDPDTGDMVTWLFSSNASWLNFDYSNRWLDGTPNNDQVGDYWVNVTAKDLTNAMTVRNFTLNVINVNDPPEILSQPVTLAEVIYEYKYQVKATDVDKGDVLIYSLAAAPVNMSIGNTTGLVTWRPTRSQAGDHHIIINVSDGNASVLQGYELTVTIPAFFIPVSTLLFPENGSIVDVKNPVLGWSAEDPDSDMILYDIYLSTEKDEVASLSLSALLVEGMSAKAFVPVVPLGKGNNYYWTVIPNDRVHGGKCSSGVWQFKVSLAAGMSTEPLSFLHSPANGTRMDDIPVPLFWSGISFGTGTLSFDVYVGTDEYLVQMNDMSTRIETGLLNESTIFKDAERGITYYWTVIPKEGSTAGKSLFGVWSFTTSTTARINHWPVINSVPPTQVYVNGTFTYDVNATDEDGDRLIYMLAIWPDGMVIDPWTGLVLWTPNASQLGDQEVLIWVTDDFLTTEQLFTVTVLNSVSKDRAPAFVTSPVLDAYVDQEWVYQFRASDPDDDPLTYSLERAPQGVKFDPVARKITWTPGSDMVGNVSFALKVSDGKLTTYQNFTVTVQEVPGYRQSEVLPFLFIGLLGIAIFVGIIGAVFIYGRSRGEARKRKERDQEMAVRVEAARASGMAEGAASAAAIAGASVAQRPQAFPAVPPEDEGVEPFEINDAFLIFKDGRMIAHSRTRETESLDQDLMSSMLVAIQAFVKESFQDGLNSFECSNKKVVMVPGNYLILVAVVDGTEPKMLRDEMQAIISKVEGLYSGIVENWDGNTKLFKDVRPYMAPLFTMQDRLKIKEKKEAVKVKSGIEFFGGFVRLKVGVSNGLDATIGQVDLDLIYDTMSLRLSHIEPEYPMQGSKMFLNDIKPKEKRSVAIYFDPVICQESSIEGIVTYTDGQGVRGTAAMKTRPVDIVCPIFYTKENINVAMLKRLIKELKYNDTKVYQITEVENLQVAYKVAKDCIQAHDVKSVREYGLDSPYEAEMWYYGEVKGTDEQIVIRAAAREWQHSLSIFVASRNLASMTGLLAEIGKDFGRAMEEWTLKGAMSTLLDETAKGEIAKTLSLLEKEKEAEAHPAESDTKGPAENGPGNV